MHELWQISSKSRSQNYRFLATKNALCVLVLELDYLYTWWTLAILWCHPAPISPMAAPCTAYSGNLIWSDGQYISWRVTIGIGQNIWKWPESGYVHWRSSCNSNFKLCTCSFRRNITLLRTGWHLNPRLLYYWPVQSGMSKPIKPITAFRHWSIISADLDEKERLSWV